MISLFPFCLKIGICEKSSNIARVQLSERAIFRNMGRFNHMALYGADGSISAWFSF